MNKEKSKRPTILILGSDGMAGSMLWDYLNENQYVVYATTRKKPLDHQFLLNILNDVSSIDHVIETVRPDYVINCIGILNQAAEDNKASAALLNSYLPHYLDEMSDKEGYKFIHISTDCVFLGDQGRHAEKDIPDATSFYGRSKALGEINNDRSVTFRTSIVGPDYNENGIGLFNWFMKQEGKILGYQNVIWSGVTTLQLARSIERSFSMDISGLFHLVNNSFINKYEMLKLFKQYTGKDIVIEKTELPKSDMTLISTRDDFKFDIPSYEVMISEMCRWVAKHEYPHYTFNDRNGDGTS